MGAHRHGRGDFRGPSAARYDRSAARWLLPPLYRAVTADVAAVTPQGGAVLDVGTGPGRLLVRLGSCRPDLAVAGVDPSEDMVVLARQRLAASRSRGLKSSSGRQRSCRSPRGRSTSWSPP